MRRLGFVGLLVLGMLAAVTVEVSAQDPQPEPTTRQQFNQVFVKLIVPGTSRNPQQNAHVVESWIAGELNKLVEKGCFALTGRGPFYSPQVIWLNAANACTMVWNLAIPLQIVFDPGGP